MDEPRISIIEQDLTGVKRDIGFLGSQMESLVSAVHELTNSVSNMGKTDWKLLASWATVIMALLAYHGELKTRPLEATHVRFEKRIEKLEDKIELQNPCECFKGK